MTKTKPMQKTRKKASAHARPVARKPRPKQRPDRHDITEWKRLEQALRDSQQRYELATSAALEGIYEWDLASNELYLSERWKQFLALPEAAHTPSVE